MVCGQGVLKKSPGRAALLAAGVHDRPDPSVPLSARQRVRLGGPWVIRRSITAARMLRSAALLVGETEGSNRNRKIASPCLTSRLTSVLDLERSPQAFATASRNTRSLIRNMIRSSRSLGILFRKCQK